VRFVQAHPQLHRHWKHLAWDEGVPGQIYSMGKPAEKFITAVRIK
jgi:hypothetical protein